MLNILLQRAGICSGSSLKNTSHSSLEVVKKYLLGQPQFFGNEGYLTFGSALHEVFLQGIRDNYYKQLDTTDRAAVDSMVRKLNNNPIVVSLMRNSTREHKFSVRLNKVLTTCILDAKQPDLRRGFDLKTTDCNTQRDFENKIRTYGYVRQGLTYKLAAQLKFFYFVGIQKFAPYNIFIVDLDAAKFKTDLLYAEKELQFLLYFYKNYGRILPAITKLELNNGTNGKERRK
jgi:hypothetical protein